MVCPTEFECAVYADGELPAPRAQKVADHLESCASCRQLGNGLRFESRVLVECFQSTDFIEFELEDETLSAPQAQNLGVVRFAAFILAMSVLLRPVLDFFEEIGARESMNWLALTGAYVVPAVVSFVD